MEDAALRLALFLALLAGAWLIWQAGLAAAGYVRIARGLQKVPVAPGSHWLLGHVLVLLKSVPWEQMCDWVTQSPPLLKVRPQQHPAPTQGNLRSACTPRQRCVSPRAHRRLLFTLD